MNSLLKITISVFAIILVSTILPAISQNAKIVLKIDDEIITNNDIENEYKYLTILNPDFSKLNKKKALIISKNSLIKEKIKSKELLKYFDLSIEGTSLNSLIKNFYLSKGLKNENEFIDFLKKLGLEYVDIKYKIQIETAWNELIYKKYKNNIQIDKKKLRKKISESKKNEDSYLLYEILFTDINQLKLIEESIDNIGFKNTATTYSISNTSKLGGKIGWINEKQLSKQLVEKIKILKNNEYTKPISVDGGKIILMLSGKKKVESILDIESELSKVINYETNKQLNLMSNMFFNKIKNNSLIDEG